jgi:hypothetical protein
MALDGRISARVDSAQRSYDTGRVFENMVLGPYKHDKEYPNALKQLIAENADRAEKPNWTPYSETMELQRNHYTGDVKKPVKRFAEDLRFEVIDAILERTPLARRHADTISNSVRYYSSVATNLDWFHGIDAWFEIQGEEGQIVTYTIDVTTDPNKRSAKADMIINQENMVDPSEGDDKFYRYLKGIAITIAEELLTRMKREKIVMRKLKRAA